MKKLLLLPALAIVFLSGCTTNSVKSQEYMVLKVMTAETFGYGFCDFDVNIAGLRKYLDNGWKIQSEQGYTFWTDAYTGNNDIKCIGSNVTLVR